MNRTIYFSAFVFLLLLALLFMLSDQLSRFSAPRSMLQSGKAIDRAAVDKAALINPHAIGLFPDPVEIRVSANDQPVDSSVDAAINKVTRKLRDAQNHLRDRVHPLFNVKIVSRHSMRISQPPKSQQERFSIVWQTLKWCEENTEFLPVDGDEKERLRSE